MVRRETEAWGVVLPVGSRPHRCVCFRVSSCAVFRNRGWILRDKTGRKRKRKRKEMKRKRKNFIQLADCLKI